MLDNILARHTVEILDTAHVRVRLEPVIFYLKSAHAVLPRHCSYYIVPRSRADSFIHNIKAT